MHGKGKLTFADGNSYEGDYRDGKREGNGTFIYSDGRKYVGGWRDGKEHGNGEYIVKGSSKKGVWEDGKKIK